MVSWAKILAAIPGLIKLAIYVALFWAGKKVGMEKMELKGLEASNELYKGYAKILSDARGRTAGDTANKLSKGGF